MSEVSIIINGVRYDAVDATGSDWCEACDLFDVCNKYDDASTELCYSLLGDTKVFKESNKKFEP